MNLLPHRFCKREIKAKIRAEKWSKVSVRMEFKVWCGLLQQASCQHYHHSQSQKRNWGLIGIREVAVLLSKTAAKETEDTEWDCCDLTRKITVSQSGQQRNSAVRNKKMLKLTSSFGVFSKFCNSRIYRDLMTLILPAGIIEIEISFSRETCVQKNWDNCIIKGHIKIN